MNLLGVAKFCITQLSEWRYNEYRIKQRFCVKLSTRPCTKKPDGSAKYRTPGNPSYITYHWTRPPCHGGGSRAMCSCCCNSQASIRLQTTSRKTKPHVAQSHWIGSETTEHRSFLCVEEAPEHCGQLWTWLCSRRVCHKDRGGGMLSKKHYDHPRYHSRWEGEASPQSFKL